MTPYYDSGGVTLYLGDAREVLPLLPEYSDGLVLTDPPYGFRKADWDDEFPTWWFEEAARIAPTLGVMPGIWNIVRCPEEVGRLHYRWTLAAWLSNGMTRGLIGFGNWIPCLVYTSDDVTAYKSEGDCKRFVVGTETKPNHPSPKPYNVMRWLVTRLPGSTVIDPFAGSGTTLRAAKDMGKRAIGIEISERYAEGIANRMSQEVMEMGA